jgi:hypothetical protein
MPLPRMVRMRQELSSTRIADVPAAVRAALVASGAPGRIRPGNRVAITAGSRGIADIPVVIRAAVDWLREIGAEPFIVPAMGSHGGATVEGQRAVLAEYGITEREAGASILATMETVVVGHLPDGTPVFLDRNAHEADGIVVVGRVKAHTAFRGPIESGLCKMTAIGLGKQRGAETIHARGLGETIAPAAAVTLATGKIVAGVGLVENSHHQLQTIRGVAPNDFHAADAELLVLANELLPRIPFDDLDLLIVDELGKNLSGSGMDYNIVGMWRRIGGDKVPMYRRIVVLGITPESEGNALGMGIADFTTRRLFEQIDYRKTYMNGLTANAVDAIKVPCVMASDRDAIEAALKSAGPRGEPRVVWIRNTLSLDEMLVSEALVDEAAALGTLVRIGDVRDVPFDADGWTVREASRLPLMAAGVAR